MPETFNAFLSYRPDDPVPSVDMFALIFDVVMRGEAGEGDILRLLRVIDETPSLFTNALTGAVRSVRAHMRAFPADRTMGENIIDVCGTGGDATQTGGGSLNISTAVAFVAAACGAPVAKHGNRSVSSRSGSADVLAALGIAASVPPERAAEALRKSGLCFLFAPDYHPALRHAAAARKRFGKPSIFNFIGPLCNPARPHRQLIGVFDFSRADDMRRAAALDRFYIVSGGGGEDELTLSPDNKILNETGATTVLTPEIFAEAGLNLVTDPSALRGGDAAYNARAMLDLFENNDSSPAYKDTVILNAAFALQLYDSKEDFFGSVKRCRNALFSGDVLNKYKELKSILK